MKVNGTQYILILIVAMMISVPSCVRKSRYIEIRNQHDSLLVAHQEKTEQLAMISSYIDTIASSIDSITRQETLLLSRTNPDGVKFSKKEIRENLERLEALINRQRSRIDELDSTLVVMKDSTNSMRAVITFLYKQLDEKDAEIKRMKIEIGAQSIKIRNLSSQVSALQGDVEDLQTKSREQTEAILAQNETIALQDSLIYTAYYMIGTKKSLKDNGILTGNVFKGNKIDITNSDMSLYTKVDIRDFSTLEISGQKPKVLSAMPSGSYQIESVSNRSHVLTISDKEKFWSTTKILIIQN